MCTFLNLYIMFQHKVNRLFSVKNPPASAERCWRPSLSHQVWEDPPERKWQSISRILAWELQGTGAWWADP